MSFRKGKRPPRIVITGGPGSGKTTLFKEVLKRYPGVIGVRELASILVTDVGILRCTDPLICRGPLWKIQKIVEDSSYRRAFVEKAPAVVQDSGSVDNAAFLPGGLEEMEELFHTSREEEYGRYDAVLWLAPPPPAAFERSKANNPARIETYQQAYNIGWAGLRAWNGHPVFREVLFSKDDWAEKSRVAFLLLEQISGVRVPKQRKKR